MVIKILGGGCPKCIQLTRNAEEACRELGCDAEIVKVRDYDEIMAYNVMSTPALVIDEKVVHSGSVLSAEKIKGLLS